jgi:hypothetical protein
MSAPKVETIELPVIDKDIRRSILERVVAETLDGRRYRLMQSPGLVQGVAAGDVIELVDSELQGFPVLERGGNICVWLFFSVREHLTGAYASEATNAIQAIGGTREGGTKQSLIFLFPISVGFKAIEQAMHRVTEGIPGADWSYGNVYDLHGKPINWWLDS